MMILLIAGLLAAETSQIPIEAGRTDWKSYPELRLAPRNLPTMAMVEKVERMLKDRVCSISGQSHRRFDITVPYVALVEPDGSPRRVVVADMGCSELETLVGEVILALAQAGDFQPTGEKQARWYASSINFNLHNTR